jgi:two-component system, NtrC family, response regulator
MNFNTILVVDDLHDNADALAEILGTEGFQVAVAYCAADALDELDRSPELRLILSDIRMPDLDGLMLLRVVKHRRPGVRVILMTGSPIDDDQDVVPEGATILNKPVLLDQLIPLLRAILTP